MREIRRQARRNPPCASQNKFVAYTVNKTDMKAAAFALALVVSTVQTVGWVECCCILICKHRNDPCSDCKEKRAQEPVVADCCEKSHHETPAPEKRCSHVEPGCQSETLAWPQYCVVRSASVRACQTCSASARM